MEAQKVGIAGILGDDIKHVLSVVGLDLTGVAMTFEISAGPEQPPMVAPAVTLLDVVTGDDGVPTSIIQIFRAAADVRAAVNGIGGLPGNEAVTLFHQLKFARLPGDLGAAAVTTIFFGDYVMKGEVNG